jgi:hypothetical protein
MRATRTVYKNTESSLKLKSIGLSIALHVIFAALILGVGASAKKPLIEEKEETMKAVLWVSTGAKKVAKPETKNASNETTTSKGVASVVEIPEVATAIDKPDGNVVKVQKKKIEDDPWLDELLALEPIIKPVEPVEPVEPVAVDNIGESLFEPKLKKEIIKEQVALVGLDDFESESATLNQSNQEQKIRDAVAEKKEETYVDPYFVYRLDVAKHIQSKWKANPELLGLKCDIDISIMRDGTILMLHSLIGDSRVCDSAKMAIKRIRKLPSAPSDDVFNKLKRMGVRLTVQ